MILTILLSWAVVSLSSAFMRQAPDYESPLENQLLMGALVQTGESSRYWVQVESDDYRGWVTEMGLIMLSDEQKDAYLRAPKWICTVVSTYVRVAPAENAQPLGDLIMGNLLRQTGITQGSWTLVLLPDDRTGWVQSTALTDFRSWAEERKARLDDSVACARAVCNLACRFAGTPYMWGGNNVKYFDCSGLVEFCFLMNGLLLPRNASQQARCGSPVTDGAYEPGDLLFFGSNSPLRISHVGIYLGDGRIVHSSQMVRINSLESYGREVVAATRIFGNIGKGAISILSSPYYFEQNGD